jgi:hypothetical protein
MGTLDPWGAATMKMPTFRFAVRSLMTFVVVAAVVMWVFQMCRRSVKYRELATAHAAREQYLIGLGNAAGGVMNDMRIWSKEEHIGFVRALRLKYERAARYPWLPVEPDPPEPYPLAGFDIRSMEGR